MFIQGIDETEIVAATGIPSFQVGSLGVNQSPTLGTTGFLYVHASEIVTAAGYVCQVDGSYECQMVDSTSSAIGQGARVGVAMAAIADNEFFWIQVYGKGSMRTLASMGVGTGTFSTATPGAVDDAATTGLEPIFGAYLGTATGGSAATNADAYFCFPTIGATVL